MFLGRYHHTVDDKGRLTIPARFRELLVKEGAYVTRGFDHNLIVMTVSAFGNIYERVNGLNLADASARQVRRLFLSSAEQVVVDKAGRILIPQFLREEVGLDSEAVIVGAGGYFEIWSPKFWLEEKDKLHNAEADTAHFIGIDLSTG